MFAGDAAPPIVYDPVGTLFGEERMRRFQRTVEQVVESQLEYHAVMTEAAWILTRADMRHTLHETGGLALDADRSIEDFGRYDPWAIACRVPQPRSKFIDATYSSENPYA